MAWLQQEEAARRRQEEALERERISYAQVSSGIQARRRKGWGGGGCQTGVYRGQAPKCPCIGVAGGGGPP